MTPQPRVRSITATEIIRPRAKELYRDALDDLYRRGDRVFLWLFAVQWIAALLLAFLTAPETWSATTSSTHIHVYIATLGGALLVLPALAMVRLRPGSVVTRYTITVGQMLWSAIFIHLSNGRIETHFHVFASLAFLSFYRNWKVIAVATAVVVVDHLIRGMLWAKSVYSVPNPEWWRFIEHAFWVVFENVALFIVIAQTRRGMRMLAQRQAELEDSRARTESKVVERTRELAASREQYRVLLETTRSVPWELDRFEQRFRYVGPQLPELLGVSHEAILAHGFIASHLHASDREAVLLTLSSFGPDEIDANLRLRRADGGHLWLRTIGTASGEGVMRGMMFDVTETHELEVQLRQAQKLESVGRLASGVAHEINTPVQFVNDSVHFVRDAIKDLLPLLDRYHALARDAALGLDASVAGEALLREHEDLDIAYLAESTPGALDRAVDGLERIADIVRSMKEFAHPDQKEMRPVDINHALMTTLTIAKNEYKYVADVETELGDLPLVSCRGGEVNQVFLNIIVNAAHAIADVVGNGQRGTIRITTSVAEPGFVDVVIADTGGGIPEAVREHVFDPFFTTKAIGKGTGQGLSIASTVITGHGGDLRFETELGKGTRFVVRLPIEGKQPARNTQGWLRPQISQAA